MKKVEINSKLERVVENKGVIKGLQQENTQAFKELFSIVKDEINNIKSNNMFKSSPKKVLVTVAKTNLEVTCHDFGLFSLVCNYIEIGLSLDINEVSISKIRETITLINKGLLTKTKANKASKEELYTMIKEIKEANK